MKKQTILFYLVVSTLFLGFASCSDDDKVVDIDKEGKPVPIERIEAKTTIDLSKYKDRHCIVGNNGWSTAGKGSMEYNYRVDGNTFIATPKSKETTYYSTYYPDKEGTNNDGSNRFSLYLHPQDLNIEKDLDQSTLEKMLNHDLLCWLTDSKVSSVINDIDLTHHGSLIRFTTENLPTDAKLRIVTKYGSGDEIKPYVKDGAYHFIGSFAITSIIYLQVGDKEYSTFFDVSKNNVKPTYVMGSSNRYHTAKLHYDSEASDDKVLSFSNSETKEWINQHFEFK